MRLRVSRRATVTIAVRNRGRVIARITRRLRRGDNVIRHRRPIADPSRWRGQRYRVVLERVRAL